MGRHWIVVLVFASAISLAQKSEWQHGVIVSVIKHRESQAADSHNSSYDVSMRIGNAIYDVLYTVPKNSSMVEYRVGADLVVRVNGETLTFNDLQGNAHTVKILRKETAAESRTQ